jgi:predicted GIY-YIG superfamily endonuclease
VQSPLGEQSDMLLLNNEWAEKLLEDYTSYPASETVKLKHGYLYLLEDTSYPEYIKLGMTRDLKRRYQEYNQHKPYNTAEFTAISEVFSDVSYVERKMLEMLKKRIMPIASRNEWFEIEHKEFLLQAVTEAESHFHLYIPH